MYELWDTLNEKLVSRHRKMYNAVNAQVKHDKRIARNETPDTFVTTAIFGKGQSPLTIDEESDILILQREIGG